MRIAIGGGITVPRDVTYIQEAERLGASSVWVPELWGADALTPLAYLAATTSSIGLASGIVQIGSRSPALLAMTAMTLQGLSGGRFLLGLGTSGPQVMEGWHGVRFGFPDRSDARDDRDRPHRRPRRPAEPRRSGVPPTTP